MKISKYIGVFALSLCTLMSCDKEVNCDDFVPGNSLFEDKIGKVTDALFVFDTTPSFVNCERVRDSYRDFIDEVKKWQDCAELNGQGLEYQEFIRDAEQGIEELDCL